MKQMLVIFLLSMVVGPLFSQEEGEVRVALVGDGIGQGSEGVDAESFARLLAKVAEQKPNVVFFLGNLVDGLEQSTAPESIKKLKNHLEQFTRLTDTYLGKQVKIYPVIGNHTFVNTQAVQLFKEHFKIKDTAPLESYQWAYAVNIEQAQFIVLASGLFERKYRGYRQEVLTMPLLDWLEKELRTNADSIRYRFVIGHMPAFSSRATEGIYSGLDKDLERRDAFWQVLKNNDALGYFASHEPLYDRLNRDGVWQIISGGAGMMENGDGSSSVFQHFILISIPKNKAKNPVLESIDIKGKIWDEFEIVPLDKPVHQLRISNRG